MGFDDRFRFSVHAVIPDDRGRVLLLRQTYGDWRWGLPGGSVEPGETITDAILRECHEEIGVVVSVGPLTGWYYHSAVESQVGIFRCTLPDDAAIVLSAEHDELAWQSPDELEGPQQVRVTAALAYDGRLHTCTF